MAADDTPETPDIRAEVRRDIREFLSTRRDRITPEQAGLPVYGGERRRVPGLRREEVALLAGVSTDYYTRLERGGANGVSESVLDGVARALQLDDAERAHLYDLIRAVGGTGPTRRRSTVRPKVRPTVQRIIDSMPGPTVLSNGRLDFLHANALGRALFAPVFVDTLRTPNSARFVFLDSNSTAFFREWSRVADDTVALLRAEAGRAPRDRELSDLIGELSMNSTKFRTRWAAHDVRLHTSGVKLVHHPLVGDLDLPYESLPLPADLGQSIVTYIPEPGSPTADALNLLASWTVTRDAGEPESADQDA